jgi:hypothetical protein
MTPAMAPGIRRWETSAVIVSVGSARPAKAFCFFVFDVIYFLGLGAFRAYLVGLVATVP